MNFAPGLEAGLSPVGLAAYDLVDSLSLRGSQYDEGEIVTPATAATDGFPVEEDGSLWEHPSINEMTSAKCCGFWTYSHLCSVFESFEDNAARE